MGLKLRIAATVFFGLLAMALCVLWGRSYWYQDGYRSFDRPKLSGLFSESGMLYFSRVVLDETMLTEFTWTSGYTSKRLPDDWDAKWAAFDVRRNPNYFSITIPYWFPTLLTACVSAIACVYSKWQFSLRTLLLATTLVAVVLGLGVWLAA